MSIVVGEVREQVRDRRSGVRRKCEARRSGGGKRCVIMAVLSTDNGIVRTRARIVVWYAVRVRVPCTVHGRRDARSR